MTKKGLNPEWQMPEAEGALPLSEGSTGVPVIDQATKIYEKLVLDGMTQIHNWNYMISHIAEVGSDDNIKEVTILFIDLDNLKTINDTRGHVAGDALIQSVVENLRALPTTLNLNDTDKFLLARRSGDEFVMMISSANEHTHYATKLNSEMKRILQENSSSDLPIRFSYGVATSSPKPNKEQIWKTVNQAETSMQVQKENNKSLAERLFRKIMRKVFGLSR